MYRIVKYMIKIALLTVVFLNTMNASSSNKDLNSGEKVFRAYCWGCHHQTAMAFGPPFNEIASKRTKGEIIAYISSPSSMYKSFGYKRTVMTQLSLTPKE